MQSIKNTAVSIILLFLSYGVYQVITKPQPSEIKMGAFEPLDISDPVEPGIPKDMLEDMQIASSQHRTNDIPQELLDGDPLEDSNFTRKSNRDIEPLASTIDIKPESTSNDLNNDIAFQPSYPVSQVSSEENINPNFKVTNPYVSKPLGTLPQNRQLASDSEIIPSTVMTPVASKPNFSDNLQPQPKSLAESWADINQLVQRANFHEALERLSKFYADNEYTESEEPQLLNWLDALAAKVIYSSEHHLRSMPYIIQPGDTIGSLARKWQIPAQLIYNVNMRQIPDPNELEAGVEIKLIQGPFDAEIDSQTQKMTLYLGSLYAGRFSIQSSEINGSGEFQIVDKSATDHLDRPYWIALNNGGSIYASESNPNGANEIALNLREAEEIFSILSATSKIKILR